MGIERLSPGARQLSVSVVWLRGKRIRSELPALLTREFIEKHCCLPVLIDERENRALIVAMEDPSDRRTVEEASRHARLDECGADDDAADSETT